MLSTRHIANSAWVYLTSTHSTMPPTSALTSPSSRFDKCHQPQTAGTKITEPNPISSLDALTQFIDEAESARHVMIAAMKAIASIFALLLLTGCQGYKVENGRWSLIRYNDLEGRMATPVPGADQNSFHPVNREYASD